MAGLWAHGSRDVAISWVVGDVANTVLFGVFAFLALRQVHGRWEALGDPHAELSDTVPESPAMAVNAQQHGVEALIRLAEAQRTGQLPGWSTGSFMRLPD